MDEKTSALAIMPARNEAERIGPVVMALCSQGLHVLVVDDNSEDHTARVASEAGAKVLRLPNQLGYGGALQAGYLYARDRGFAAVLQLDADGQHDPAYAMELLRPILAGECDACMGSRFLGEAGYRVPRLRRIGQRLFGWLAERATGERITDPTTGFQALTARVIDLYCTRIFPDDYPDADMRIILHRAGMRVREIPVRMHADDGRSMHSGIIKPMYYVYKMSIAMFIALFVELPEVRRPA